MTDQESTLIRERQRLIELINLRDNEIQELTDQILAFYTLHQRQYLRKALQNGINILDAIKGMGDLEMNDEHRD